MEKAQKAILFLENFIVTITDSSTPGRHSEGRIYWKLSSTESVKKPQQHSCFSQKALLQLNALMT